MKRILTTTLLACAASSALAAVTLEPTLSAPAELQLNEYAIYKLSVRNGGNTTASGVSVRVNLPAGMTPAGPWPTACQVVGQFFQCSAGSIPARKSRDYAIVFKAPPSPQNVVHRLRATANSTPTVMSAPVTTSYQNFSIPISGNAVDEWEMSSCYGGTSGVAYNLCPPGSEMVGDVKLHAGGAMEDLLEGMPGSWMQNSPTELRLDTPAGSGYDAWFAQLTAIDSKCFRGAGQSLPLVVGQLPFRTANKICRK